MAYTKKVKNKKSKMLEQPIKKNGLGTWTEFSKEEKNG